MARKKKRKKYVRNYPNNPKKDSLLKKIPFTRSISRGTVISFMETCENLGIEPSPMTEELLLDFINSVNKRP